MDSNDALNRILANLQNKYSLMNTIYSTTKEMKKSLEENFDDHIFAELLGKRQSAMNTVDGLDMQNRQLIARLPQGLREKIGECLAPSGVTIVLDNPLQTNIFETSKRLFVLLRRTIEEDDELNRRVKMVRSK